jgi:hypothetical protein
MARPDRQRKAKKKPDPNTRFNPMTGRREPIPRPKMGKNPLDVKQFPNALPKEMDRDIPGMPPFELPSDFPEPGKGIPPGFDPMGDIQRQQKQVDQVRLNRDLRSQLEAKKKTGRKQTAMRAANTRRQTRTFRDPANLQRFIDSRPTGPSQTAGGTRQGQTGDMDDTIVKSGDQHYRYDAEIDAFTPVAFDPAKNRFEFDDQGKGAAEAESDARKTSVEDSMKVAQKAFDKQMGELRGLADQDQQFGDMYQELQSEYMSILRDQNLRPEERNAALQDLFDRGSSTFEATSGFARAAKEQETMQKQQEAKAKMDEDIQYRNRRAIEAKEEIRKKQEDARYEDRKERLKYSETSQRIDESYKAHQQSIENYNASDQALADGEKKAMSLEEFTQQHYEKMVQDKKLGEQVQKVDVDISLIETEIGQLENEDTMEYRRQLTTIYGQGRQDAADAAFQHHLDQRAAKIAGLQRKKNNLATMREGLIDQQGAVYEAKRSTAKGQQERKAFFADAVNESRQQQRDQSPSLLDMTRGGMRESNKIMEESREVARGTEKIATRELRLERDAQGKATNVNSPEFIRDMTGDQTMLGKLRRLSQATGDSKMAEKYYGDDSGLRKERVRLLQQFEDMLENEPAGQGEEGFSLRQRAIQRLEDVINFERGLGEEQVGSRGQPKQRFDAEDKSIPASVRFGRMG